MAGHYKSINKKERTSTCTSKITKDLNRNDPPYRSGKASPTMKCFLRELSPTTRLGGTPPEVKLETRHNKVPIYSFGKVFKCQNNDLLSHKNGKTTNYGGNMTLGTVSKKKKNQPNRNMSPTHYNMSSVYREVTAKLKAEMKLSKSRIKKSSARLDQDNLTQTQRIKSAFGRLESTNVSTINLDNDDVKSTVKGCKNDSSTVSKQLLQRPTSSVTTKLESNEYRKKWQDRGKCDQVKRNTFLQEKTSKGPINEPIPKGKPLPVNIEPQLKPEFNVQGSTISRPTSGVLKTDDEKGKDVATIDEKFNQMNRDNEEDIINDSAEDIEMIENSGACFLTETLDSPTAQDSDENTLHNFKDVGGEKLVRFETVNAWDNCISINKNVDKSAKTEDSSSSGSRESNSLHCLRKEKKSEPVTSSIINLELLENNSEIKDDMSTTMVDSFPYKLDSQLVCTDLVISDEKVIDTYLGRQLPQSLGPLMDFMCKLEDSEKLHQLTGMSPEKCLMYIPDIDCYNIDTLNEVPSIQHVDDDLPYTDKVVTTVTKKPATHPKWQNRYSSASLRKTRKLCDPKRTISTVKKEISHLENVVKGVVCDENESIVTKFQADIARLRSTAKSTLDKMPSDKPSSSHSKDRSGLRKFYKEHDVKINKLRKQHTSCLEELAKLEIEAEVPEQ